jgi:APA family basic amino acid/polyamine antiporter
VFNWIVLLAVLLTLLPHLFATGAEIKLGGQAAPRAVAVIAFVFVLYTIYGVGLSVILWGLVLMLAGMPLYFVLRREKQPVGGSR